MSELLSQYLVNGKTQYFLYGVIMKPALNDDGTPVVSDFEEDHWVEEYWWIHNPKEIPTNPQDVKKALFINGSVFDPKAHNGSEIGSAAEAENLRQLWLESKHFAKVYVLETQIPPAKVSAR